MPGNIPQNCSLLFIPFCCQPVCVNMLKEFTSAARTNAAGKLQLPNSNKTISCFLSCRTSIKKRPVWWVCMASHQPPPSTQPVSHPAPATRPSLSKQRLQSGLDLTDYYLKGKKQTHLAAVQHGAYVWLRVVNLNSALVRVPKGSRCYSGVSGYEDRLHSMNRQKICSSHGL